MTYFIKAIILFVFLAFVSYDIFARPIPPVTQTDALNDWYAETDETGGEPALRTYLEGGTVSTSAVSLEMVDSGTTISFTSTNVLDSAYVTVKTLTVDIDKMQVTNNSDGAFILRIDSTDVG